MSNHQLIKQLSALGSGVQAPAVWREQTKARLLANIGAQVSGYTWTEKFRLSLDQLRYTFAPLRLSQVAVAAVVLAMVYQPASAYVGSSLPGSSLYGVKRFAERVELSLKASSASQGLFYLELADKRLNEAKLASAVGAGAVTEASLLREYNINLGFAQASLQDSRSAGDTAAKLDGAAVRLAGELTSFYPQDQNKSVYQAALDITGTFSNRALALLVASHGSGEADEQGEDEVQTRLQQEIIRVEQKLSVVEVKVTKLPVTKPAPRVVIDSRAAVVPASEASVAAKEALEQAKTLVQQKEFTLALEKVQESEAIAKKAEAVVDQAGEEEQEAAEAKDAAEQAPANEQPKPKVKGDELVLPQAATETNQPQVP